MLSLMASTPELWAVQLGRLPYTEGLALQERVRSARGTGAIPDTLLLLEHDPVYTRGRRTDPSELPFPEAWYAERGIAIVDVNRGGRATYHGPGQLTGYPIVHTTDVLEHVRGMERAIASALAQEGVTAAGRPQDGPDFTGVWVDGERKIASIGVHVRQGITTHGFAINVENDLTPFEWIVPCGLQVRMTSLEVERGRPGGMACMRRRMAHAYAVERGLRLRLVTPEALERSLAAADVAHAVGA
jgi:lipoyl(octanoyl) transferase